MLKKWFSVFISRMFSDLSWKMFIPIFIGAGICTFGIHNIHQQTGITEGGVIGLMLLIEHWLGSSPAAITPILDISCYLLAFRYLGARFIGTSGLSGFPFSLRSVCPYFINSGNCSRRCCRICRIIRCSVLYSEVSLSEWA